MFLCQESIDDRQKRIDGELEHLAAGTRELYGLANKLVGEFQGMLFNRRHGRSPEEIAEAWDGEAATCFRSMELLCRFLGAAHELMTGERNTSPRVVPDGWDYTINDEHGTVRLEQSGAAIDELLHT